MKKKDESKVIGIVIYCDNLKKEVIIKGVDGLSSSSQECELCGSHGSTNFYTNGCECGKWHDIEVNSW